MSKNMWIEESKKWKMILLVETRKDKLHIFLYVPCLCSLSRPDVVTV